MRHDNVVLDKSVSRRRPTLRDVGHLAHVDPSIASRVLGGEMNRVSEETRVRILAAAEELGWRPHPAARSLRTGTTSTIALIVPNIHNPAYGAMIRGAQHAAAAADHVMVFADMEAIAGDSNEELLRISQHVDGLIIATATATGLSSLDDLSSQVPTLLLNRRGAAGIPAVLGPDAAGAETAAEHLVELGHRRIAILTGPITIDTAVRRLDGFTRALERHGITPQFVVSADLNVDAAAAVVTPLLALPREQAPTAIFAAALTAALGAMVAARDAGFTIPADLSVIGLDDAQVTELVTPGLTTIRMPHEAMGARAVETLLKMMKGEQVDTTISVEDGPQLMVRGTTAVLR